MMEIELTQHDTTDGWLERERAELFTSRTEPRTSRSLRWGASRK